jgi:gamma-glutamyltranspeptidase/glutathione hydrolase
MRDNYWTRLLQNRITRRRALATGGSLALGATLFAACGGDDDSSHGPAGFDPEKWPEGDLDRYLQLQTGFGRGASEAEGTKAMVAGTTDPFAVHAGLEVLKNGGNAVDGALTASLAQVALNAGATVSYAGYLTAVYYDAASGKVESLNAGYNTVRGELDPLSIPQPGVPSGRTVLVPGFMAGVEALHTRYGGAPFASLFEPAVWLAEEGIPVHPALQAWMTRERETITRLPGGAKIFSDDEGRPYASGDIFRQPALAETLRQVASQGAGYMYEGEWAKRFVEAVKSEGGKMEMDDMAAYQAIWGDPAHISYGDYEVFSLGEPSVGGLITLGSLNVAQAANLKEYGHYASSPEALYYLIQIIRSQAFFAYSSDESRERLLPGIDPSPESLLTEKVARQFWELIQEQATTFDTDGAPGSDHSAGVVAVDEEGNVVSILHTINTNLWGSTGLFVEGISIPDSASIQQGRVYQAGPGRRLPEGTNPTLVTKQRQPFLASATIGNLLLQVNIQNLVSILDFGMDPRDAIDQPHTLGFHPPEAALSRVPWLEPPLPEAVRQGAFEESVLEGASDLGQPFERVRTTERVGYWAAIQLDDENGKLTGVASDELNPMVEGF